MGNNIEIRKIKTKEELDYASKVASKDSGHNIPYPTHILYNKDGDVVGLWSLANVPLVLVWHHTQKIKKTDSIYLVETYAALMDEKGYKDFFIACDKDSPYYKHMDKLGYESLNWDTSMFYKNLNN
tara:strand:- start:4532 stop:4909 length:378 start_codon:yes stop_codon:yes gene_type:complete